jgi:outer membrane scaffolding protein for murein synthesis (MipA/OmpV family)
MQVLYGVTPQQSAASGHPIYEVAHDGTSAAGVGFSATKFFGEHWLLNLDSAINQIRGSPSRSPIVEKTHQHVVVLSINYHW